MSNHLQHYGILGQKWGRRRYENYDGSLTPEGKERYAKNSKDYRFYNKATNEVSKASRSAANVVTQFAGLKKKKESKKINLSNMTDKDIQDRLRRLDLEARYKNYLTEEIASGKERAASILQTVGEIAAVGSSIAGIAAAYYTIKKGAGK